MRRLDVCVGLVLLGCLLGLSGGCKAGGSILPGFNSNAERTAMLSRHNATRSSAGVPALSENALLNQIAMQQAQYEASIGDFSHEDASGNHVDVRATNVGYNWVAIGENVGYDISAAQLYTGWLGSPGHYGNIVDTDFTEIGIGVAQAGIYQYWCIVFGNQ
jgi:uncharacterized protein YkwD